MPVDLDHVKPFMGFCTAFIYIYIYYFLFFLLVTCKTKSVQGGDDYPLLEGKWELTSFPAAASLSDGSVQQKIDARKQSTNAALRITSYSSSTVKQANIWRCFHGMQALPTICLANNSSVSHLPRYSASLVTVLLLRVAWTM